MDITAELTTADPTEVNGRYDAVREDAEHWRPAHGLGD